MSIDLELPTEQSRQTAAQFRGYLKSLPDVDDRVANDIALYGQIRPFRDLYGDPEQPLGTEFDAFSNDFVFDLRSSSPDKFDETIDMWKEEQREMRTNQVLTRLIVDVELGRVPDFQEYVANKSLSRGVSIARGR